ncbi:variant erythrocyte surface antigen-1, alpha subunit [Babesia caballi]|uniref:Variant erythrocyte surface antigen-1, alpha subunit n=1 Tax=Babesia caballi TaxID=5871 RepID=A0AAV4LNR3_BABCB|nr:variant erythrocyte surface antigen-1, alpha subunit [Babesia caballi]
MTHTPAKKLTDCPSNLKEAIDWILRATGKDGVDTSPANPTIEALAREVCKLLGLLKGAISRDVSGIIREIEDYDGSGHGPISKLAEALRVFIGYDRGPRGTIEGTGIAMKPKQNANKPYNSLEEWRNNNAGGRATCSGYQWKSLSKNKCDKVMKSVANVLKDLNVSKTGGYSAFLNQLENNARPNLDRHVTIYPLYGLYYAACEYFKFQYQLNNNIVYIKNIESTLNNLKPSNSYDDFKQSIQTFISQVKKTVDSGSSERGSEGPRKLGSSGTGSASRRASGSSGHGTSSPKRENENASGAAADTISSSVSYVTGGLVGTAAVGTGVALATNVGGITTLIKGAIGMV